MHTFRVMVLAIAAVTILGLVVTSAIAADYYVDQSATGTGSGADWTNAFTTIEDGIKACSGTSADTVHVAAATYAENLVLDNYVTLLGGYPPGGGTRDPDTNVTIIDGKGTGIAVHIENKIEICIDGFTIQNGYRAGTGGGVRIYNDASARITNCVVQDSNATTNGGGIYIYYDCVVEISDCEIINNKAREGAGIYVYDAEMSISGCRISYNDAVNVGSVSRLGGGIRCGYWSDVTIDECDISYNTADYDGGGIYADHVDSLVVTDCNIFGNRAKHWGGGFYGAYYDFELRDCVIRDNLADSTEYNGYGGGLSFYEGAVDRCEVINCIVRSNKAEDGGGGVYCSGSEPSFENTVISDNEVTSGNGGGFYCEYDSAPSLMNCIVVDNRADYGGGIYNAYNSGHTASVTVHSCTFSENEAYLTDSGGAIFLEDDTSAEVRDSILWRDRPNETDGTGTFTITYSDVDGSGYGEDGGCTPDGKGNMDCDPLFVSGYYLSETGAGQESDSPCINRGDDTAENLDLDDRTTRTDGVDDTGMVDMGYHYLNGSSLHHYVDEWSGDDSNGGTSWSDAFLTIQAAI
ncbi:MAG: right-handed parallel beta-helix repeat-containing protein, partial [Candidatus Coatesbacteria bacterium]|nr:right-handed parallel beta-helix repeat-containing protein [Candidatus Coatesbacteria bacterium]